MLYVKRRLEKRVDFEEMLEMKVNLIGKLIQPLDILLEISTTHMY